MVDSKPMKKIVMWFWSVRKFIELPMKIGFLVLAGVVGYLELYLSQSAFKYLWLAPIALTLLSLESLWNPFRIIALCSVWLGASSVATQSVATGLAAIAIFVGSLVCWYLFIQRPADEATSTCSD